MVTLGATGNLGVANVGVPRQDTDATLVRVKGSASDGRQSPGQLGPSWHRREGSRRRLWPASQRARSWILTRYAGLGTARRSENSTACGHPR